MSSKEVRHIGYRDRVEGISIGCPVVHGEHSCSRNCGGGWPGTKMESQEMVKVDYFAEDHG